MASGPAILPSCADDVLRRHARRRLRAVASAGRSRTPLSRDHQSARSAAMPVADPVRRSASAGRRPSGRRSRPDVADDRDVGVYAVLSISAGSMSAWITFASGAKVDSLPVTRSSKWAPSAISRSARCSRPPPPRCRACPACAGAGCAVRERAARHQGGDHRDAGRSASSPVPRWRCLHDPAADVSTGRGPGDQLGRHSDPPRPHGRPGNPADGRGGQTEVVSPGRP